MKFAIVTCIAMTTSTFLLTSCWTLTPEEIKHEQWQQEQQVIKQDKDRVFQLEQLKLEAEIQKAKPESVKLQEVKNEETTFGEWLQNAAWIWAATVAGISILHILTK